MVGRRYLVFVLVARRSARFSGPCVATDPGYRVRESQDASRIASCVFAVPGSRMKIVMPAGKIEDVQCNASVDRDT